MARYSVSIATDLVPGPGLPPLYDVVLDRYGRHTAEFDLPGARAVAKVMAEDSGRHTRVVVVGCDRDADDFGPRPDGYRRASITARRSPRR